MTATTCTYCASTFTPAPPRRRVCPACCRARMPTKPAKPAKPKPVTPFTAGLEQFRLLREDFLTERLRILNQPGDFMQRMADLDSVEIEYRNAKLALYHSLPPLIRQRVWRRVLAGK